ncbi:TIGD3 protein, partial [Urocolius indicus]|nr:TIGD3 protein [Urocolius indicus]
VLEGPKVSQSELAKRFGVSQPQICRIIKNRERILSEWRRQRQPERKRRRDGGDAALEAALLRWVEGTGSFLQLEARQLAEALGQPGSEPSTKPPAEGGDVERAVGERWLGAVPPGILRGYAPSQIYACGDTGVPLPGGSPGTQRLTLLLCANADGSEKVPLWVLGESSRPRCLQGVNLRHMPWRYRAGCLAAGSALPLAEWLREFGEGLRRRGRSALLLLPQRDAQPCPQPHNVRVVFIPAPAQPLERGVTGDLKGHFQRRLLRRLPAGRPTLLDTLHTLAQAWGDVSPELIASCFRAAGFSPDAGSASAAALAPAAWREQGAERAAGEDAEAEEGAVEDVQPCPSEREVWRSLATLRRYLECRATSPEHFQAFYELEDAVHAVRAG